MAGPFQPLQLLARGAGDAVRVALRRAAMIGFALLFAASGAGFLTLAAYLALRRPLGPELAALALGVTLLAVSAGLVLVVRARVQNENPRRFAESRRKQPITARPAPADAATMAVFMVAFLIGRRLADRWDQTR